MSRLKGRKSFKERLGITPEWCNDEEAKTMTVKHIGKGSDGKWYGWSHRAYHGFERRDAASDFAHSVS